MSQLGKLETGGEDEPLYPRRVLGRGLLELGSRRVTLARQLAHLLAGEQGDPDGEEQAQNEPDGEPDHHRPSSIGRRVRRLGHRWRGVLGVGHGDRISSGMAICE